MPKKNLPKTAKLYFDGVQLECLVQDKGDEIVCTAKDRRFVKFPSSGDFTKMLAAHNRANDNIPDEPNAELDAQAAELAAWTAGE